MKSISLYRDNGTWLCSVHPFTKLMYITFAILVPLFIHSLWAYAALIILDIAILISGKILKRSRPLIIFSLTIIVTIFIIKGLFDEDNVSKFFSIGPIIFYKEGLMKALRTGAVIINMLLSFAAFVLTTRPSDLTEELEKHGFPPRLCYVITSVFNIIPQMMGTVNTIMDAQKSRGMETEGKLSVRIKAFIPLITPVVSSSLINTRERAIALEVRGFGSRRKRSFVHSWKKHRGDKAITIMLFAAIILSALWRIFIWLS